jgi:hypothetical protein
VFAWDSLDPLASYSKTDIKAKVLTEQRKSKVSGGCIAVCNWRGSRVSSDQTVDKNTS